jgi:hypothetical protein
MVGFSTEQAQLDRAFTRLALIVAQRKAVSIAGIARAVPILAPDDSLIPCLGVSVPAVRLSSNELDRFIGSLQCTPVALSKTIFGSDDDEDVNKERPMKSAVNRRLTLSLIRISRTIRWTAFGKYVRGIAACCCSLDKGQRVAK